MSTQLLENTSKVSQEALVSLCHKSFRCFYNFIWGASIKIMEGGFKMGKHLDEWCDHFQFDKNLSILSARKHSKSEIAHGYLGWRIFNMDYTMIEKWLYLSYSQDLAGEHLAETKERIRVNPFYRLEGLENLTEAKTILYYRKGGKRLFACPSGILTFKRGKHPDGVITDDILKDPEAKLDMSQVTKISEIFLEQIMSMPKEGGLGVKNIGTAQDESDIFHVLEGKKQFKCYRLPATDSMKTWIPAWPDMFSPERLQEICYDELGEKAFMKEMMCVPVRSADGFFIQQELDTVVYAGLKNYRYFDKPKLREYTYAGLDIGKKRHPSHISVFGRDRRKRLVQVLSLWLDGVDYTKQLEICKEIIANFNTVRFYYDDTRAEMEGFKESGSLPAQMKGFPFTEKLKHNMAVQFEKSVKNRNIMLVNDARQKRQILNCDNDLKSMETPEGHGDSFWSNCLAIHASQTTGGNIRLL